MLSWLRSKSAAAAPFELSLLIGLILMGNALVIVLNDTQPVTAAPADQAVAQLAVEAPTTTTTATAAPSTAVTTAAPPTSVVPARPATVPRDPYANEPIQEIGTIEIPKIGLVHPIFHGITMRNIDRGPSHWPGTAFPGEVGNAVFAGHRVTKTKPFRNIDQLVQGDQVIFTVNGIRTTYAVTGSEVVKPTQLEIVNPTANPTATLFACHPPGSARFRYVVRAALVETAQSTASTTGP